MQRAPGKVAPTSRLAAGSSRGNARAAHGGSQGAALAQAAVGPASSASWLSDGFTDAALRGQPLSSDRGAPVNNKPSGASAETSALPETSAAPGPRTGDTSVPTEGGDHGPVNAPTEQYIVPFDRNPQAAPGERIIFRAVFTDSSPADYEMEFSTTGGHFQSSTGPTSVTINGLNSDNLDFFVPSPWDGSSTVQATFKLRRKSDGNVLRTETWNFGLKAYYPTTMTQQEGTGERTLPAVYSYDIGPARQGGSAPYYEHQTILERFLLQSVGNINPADIDETYRNTHNLTNAEAISNHFINRGSGGNGTFTVDANDRIYDQHGGHGDVTNLVNHLTTPKEIHLVLPQVYESEPGVEFGAYTVTRVRKTDGSWKVKKEPT